MPSWAGSVVIGLVGRQLLQVVVDEIGDRLFLLFAGQLLGFSSNFAAEPNTRIFPPAGTQS
jgi:hypothetical protein